MKKKDIFILSAKILATVLLFFYVNKSVNFSEFEQINKIGLIFFIAVLFGFLQQFFLLCRWYFSLKTLEISCGIKSIIKSYFIGQFLGTISPARSGDLAKVFYLENTPHKRGLYAVILDSVVAMITLFIAGLWKNYPITDDKNIQIIDKILSATGIFLSAAIIISVIIIVSGKIKFKQNVCVNFAKLFSISLLQNTVLIIQGTLIFGILLPISFLQTSFAVASAYCVMRLIPFAIASIGAREFSFLLFISAFFDKQSAMPIVFTASYILLLCNSIIFMIPGIFLFYFDKKK